MASIRTIGSFRIFAGVAKMKPKHLEREVRRVRHLAAWVNVNGRARCECQVLDISRQGAKVVVDTPELVPDYFELAFFQGDQKRICKVIWRRAKMLGVQFLNVLAPRA
jgi:hypothetical protein